LFKNFKKTISNWLISTYIIWTIQDSIPLSKIFYILVVISNYKYLKTYFVPYCLFYFCLALYVQNNYLIL